MNNFIINKLDSIPNKSNLTFINPDTILCDNDYCAVISGSKALYFDDNHLSIAGAKILVGHITKKAH